MRSPKKWDLAFAKALLPCVAQLLLEYVKIADLIRHGIIVPASNAFGLYDDFESSGRIYRHNKFFVSNREKGEIIDLLAGIPRYRKEAENVENTLLVASMIKEQIWFKQRAQNRIDLYFWEEVLCADPAGIIAHRYSSKRIYEPFEVGVLANLARLDTSPHYASRLAGVA